MRTTILAAVALALLCVQISRAADDSSPKWKKIVLSNVFYSEGANFGDFNHDGKADVVSGPYWYEGPDFNPAKRHEFMPVKSFKPDNQYSENFFAFCYDFNHDGWDDILIIGFPGKEAFWYENPKGKEGHWEKHLAYDNVDDESPNFVDFFKDGKPVIVCCSHGYIGYVQFDAADPNKPWMFHAVSPKGNYQKFTHGIGYGDVNGDGRNDILESHGWWEQPEKLDDSKPWKFHPNKFFEDKLGDGCSQMYAYDVNGDGRPDVICALQAHGYGLAWFEQKMDGSFEKHLIMGSKPDQNAQGAVFSQLHAVDLVDMNGDGLLDILTGKRYFAHGSHGDVDALGPAVLYWFELKRDGHNVSYVAHKIDDDSGVGTQVVAKAVDGNKIPSIVVGNKKGTFVFVPEK
jgi:hypothetical protein